jgi:hypothetical protein
MVKIISKVANSSSVAEQSTHYPKFKGSNPATASTWRDAVWQKVTKLGAVFTTLHFLFNLQMSMFFVAFLALALKFVINL